MKKNIHFFYHNKDKEFKVIFGVTSKFKVYGALFLHYALE